MDVFSLSKLNLDGLSQTSKNQQEDIFHKMNMIADSYRCCNANSNLDKLGFATEDLRFQAHEINNGHL